MDNQTPYTPPIPQIKAREYKPLDKKDIAFILLYLMSSFLIVDFALFNGFSTGLTISYIVFFIITTAYVRERHNKIPAFSFICGALSVLGSFSFALFNNELMTFFMIVLVGGLFGIYCIGLSTGIDSGSGSFRFIIRVFKTVAIEPFSNIGEIFGSARASAKEYKKSFSAVIGFIVALPVLCVIIPLLAKSDAAFEGLVLSVIRNIGKYLLEIAIAVILLVYLYPFAFGRRKGESVGSACNALKRCFPVSACTSFLSAVSIVYVVYLFSQLAYFFSAFKGILPDNYEHTASAFARRGFYEMFAVCAINIAMVSVVSMLARKKTIAIKLLSGFISLFSVLLIVVAMEKMKLNISIFGLTSNRVLVSGFMLMVLFVTICFIIHIFAPKLPYLRAIIIFCSVLFITMSFADIDMRVAEYNVNAYNNGVIDTLDIEHLCKHSDSAVPQLVKLCQSDNHMVSAAAKRLIIDRIYYNYGDCFIIDDDFKSMKYKSNYDFRSFNLAKQNAQRAIMEYYDSLDEDEREYLLTYYKYLENGYYDEDADIYYYHGPDGDIAFSYDENTGSYTTKTQTDDLITTAEAV